MRKYKLTGCARFLIFLLIATPIAYFAASYYNNQNPIQTVKTWFTEGPGEDKTVPPPLSTPAAPDTTGTQHSADSMNETYHPVGETDGKASVDDAATFRELLNDKDRQIEQLIRENERLRNELDRLKQKE